MEARRTILVIFSEKDDPSTSTGGRLPDRLLDSAGYLGSYCVVETLFLMIRYLTPADHDIYATLRLEALRSDPDAFGEMLETAMARSEEEWRGWLAGVIVPGRKNVIALEENGAAIAMCGFGLADDDRANGFLWGMFVSRSHRGKKLGGLMLSEVERWLREHGGKVIRSCVAAPNQDAIEFYRRRGFTLGSASGLLRCGSDIPAFPIEKRLV